MASKAFSSLFLFLFLSSSLLSVALGVGHRINDAQGLIDLSNNVSSGTNYSGTTVFLDSDIDFSGGYSEGFAPIGYNSNNYFKGAFDGQGHTISNLKTNSSSRYVGLFGYSEGTTIQNVVIDGSCSFISKSENPFVGSFIGRCSSNNGPCAIESVVNIGSVVFEGNATGNVFVGGIAGYISSANYPITLKNCVNYGFVTHSGEGSSWAVLGGISGMSQGKSTSYISIQNCLNYGTITHNGTSKNLAVGGIAGNSQFTTFENCVSSGAISSSQESKCIGGIVGYVSFYGEVTHCFWTSDAGNVNACGVNEDKVNITKSSLATLDQATLDELNRYTTEEKKDSTWSKWVMLHLNGGRINNISQQSLVGIASALPVPEPVREGNTFLFWCKDAVCGEVFDPETDDVSTLYAGWKINTVTFDLGNGTVLNETFTFNTSIEYPKGMVREGHTFNGWDSTPELMPPMDITIKAQWTPNNYTVAFDVNEGDELPTPTKAVTFNTSYGELPTPKKTNFTFLGWFNDKNERVTGNTIVNIPSDHTLHAHWNETKPGYVEVVFGRKDMSEEEIKDIIKQYTDSEEFTIIKIEDYGSGETRAIIKFVDVNEATNFIEVVNVSRSKTLIKNVGLIEGIASFSLALHPMMLLSLILF